MISDMDNQTNVCETVFFFQLPSESIIYEWLDKIHTFYSVKELHTHVSIIMCIIGTICNFCNIVVLTRKTMRAPVNMILTAMACCDTVVLFSNLIYTTHYKYVAYEYCTPANWSYGWVMFLIAHAHLSLIGHSSSLWLSVMLGFLRYMTLRNRTGSLSQKICLKHSYIAIASVVIFVTFFNGPNFLSYKIREDRLNESCEVKDARYFNEPAYIPDQSDLAKRGNCLLLRLALWISGIIFKVVPCILLTIFICLLMKILNEVKKNRIRLAMNNHCDSGTSSFSLPVNQPSKTSSYRYSTTAHLRTNERTDRTTKMLLAIVIVFLLTEVPQGILTISLGIFSDDFRNKIYVKIGDILDLLSLCNACTTFIIYCSMSGQFRSEFQRVFLPFMRLLPPSTGPRRSSDGFVSRLCYLKPADRDNGSTGRERSTTMRSAISVSSYNYAKENGRAKLTENDMQSEHLLSDEMHEIGDTNTPDDISLATSNNSTPRREVDFHALRMSELKEKEKPNFLSVRITDAQNAVDNITEKTELLKRSPGGGGVFEKKTGKMLEARYRATQID